MKRQIISFISVLLLIIFSLSACIPDEDKDNKDKSSQSFENGQYMSSDEDTKSDAGDFDFDSEYKNIASQLEELERILDSLDVFSEDDLEIPEP